MSKFTLELEFSGQAEYERALMALWEYRSTHWLVYQWIQKRDAPRIRKMIIEEHGYSYEPVGNGVVYLPFETREEVEWRVVRLVEGKYGADARMYPGIRMTYKALNRPIPSRVEKRLKKAGI